MQSQLIAVVLCIFATTASAQCIAKPDAASAHLQRTDLISAPAVRTDGVAVRPLAASNARPGLITAAGAATTGGPVREGTTVARAPMGTSDQGETPQRRGSTAMVLAALALMSGIALRRFGTTGR